MSKDRVDRSIAELGDGLSFIRKLAASNLARYGDARAIPALEKAAAGDADGEVRAEAAKALEKLRGASGGASSASPPSAAPAAPPSSLTPSPSLAPSSSLVLTPSPSLSLTPSAPLAPTPTSPLAATTKLASTPLRSEPLPWETAAREPLPWETRPAPSLSPPPSSFASASPVVARLEEVALAQARIDLVRVLQGALASKRHALEVRRAADAFAALGRRETRPPPSDPPRPPGDRPRPQSDRPRPRIERRPTIPPPEPPEPQPEYTLELVAPPPDAQGGPPGPPRPGPTGHTLPPRDGTERRRRSGSGDALAGARKPGAPGGPSIGAAGGRDPREGAEAKGKSTWSWGCLAVLLMACVCPVGGIIAQGLSDAKKKAARMERVEREREREAVLRAQYEQQERQRLERESAEERARAAQRAEAAERRHAAAAAGGSAHGPVGTETRDRPDAGASAGQASGGSSGGGGSSGRSTGASAASGAVSSNLFSNLYPDHGSVLADGAITLRGTIKGLGWKTIEVAAPFARKGEIAQHSTTAQFVIHGLNLPAGRHDVHLVARAEDGRTAERTMRIVVDLEDPGIEDMMPANGSVVRSEVAEIEVEGRVVDESAVSGTLARTPLRIAPDGSFQATLPLEPGENGFDLTLTDELGRHVATRYTLFRCPPLEKGAQPAWSRAPEVRVHPKDEAEMVLVPEGRFVMGGMAAGVGTTAERPAHVVALAAFWIDRYPVTRAQFDRFAKATGRTSPRPPTGSAVPMPDDAIAGVTHEEAAAYAAWAGKRLPTEAEWEKAARGDDARRYPWGNAAPTPEHGPFGKEDLAVRKKRRFETKAFEKNASPYGAVDMVGCVAQWCADFYDGKYYAQSPARDPQGPATGKVRVIRGSSALVSHTSAPERARTTHRTSGDPKRRMADVGFRCAVGEWPK